MFSEFAITDCADDDKRKTRQKWATARVDGLCREAKLLQVANQRLELNAHPTRAASTNVRRHMSSSSFFPRHDSGHLIITCQIAPVGGLPWILAGGGSRSNARGDECKPQPLA